jgi:hypothetical protein
MLIKIKLKNVSMRSSLLHDVNLIVIQKFYLNDLKKFNIFIKMTIIK